MKCDPLLSATNGCPSISNSTRHDGAGLHAVSIATRLAVAVDPHDPGIIEYRGVEFAPPPRLGSNHRNGVIFRLIVGMLVSRD
jgi:hypothetical protein